MECDAESLQTCENNVFYCGHRPRRLQCCALSPCGRFLAAGESGNRATSVLVFDRQNGGAVTVLRGHNHGVRFLAWSPRSDFLVSIADAESEQSDQQLFLWSWPQGERVTAAICARGVVHLAFSPDKDVFAVVGATSVKYWSIERPQRETIQEGQFTLRHRSQPQLVGHAVPPQVLGLPRRQDDSDRRRLPDERLVSAAWSSDGETCVLHVLGRRGRLCSIVNDETERWVDINQKANVVGWAPKLCDSQVQQGVLLCGLVGGAVQVLDAASLQPVATLPSASGASDAVGICVSPCGEAFWVLYADKSLARWRGFHDAPDALVPAPVPYIRDAQTVPQAAGLSFGVPQVVTCTERGLQLWTSSADGLKIESRTEPGTSRTGELTAVAVSPWAVACGHRGGEVHLLALPRLHSLDTLPVRHTGDVVALSFGSVAPSPGGPQLLASASHDRCVMVFRLDVRRHTAAGVQACNVSLLLNLPGHSAAIQSLAILGSAELPDVQLAVATADKLLVLRDVDLSRTAAAVRRSHKHVGRARWIGLCVHPERAMLFAACADKRVLQLDCVGRCRQAVRVTGADVELIAPMRLSEHGRILAVGVGGSLQTADAGILLLDTWAGLRPLARLVGHAEPASGIAFLGGSSVLACWSDGAMLGWDKVDQQQPPPEGHRLDDRERVTPLRVRSPQREGLALSPSRSPIRSFNPQHNRPPKMGQSENDKLESTPVAAHSASGCPDGLLERLLASSPRPPRWAGGKNKDGLGFDSEDEEEDVEQPSFNVDVNVRTSTPLGKWARGSRVGAQVRSTSDLLAISSISDLQSVIEEAGKGPILPNSAGGVRGHPPRASSVPVRSSSTGSILACGEGAGAETELMPAPEPGTATTSPTCCMSTTTLFSARSMSLRPLPPKPSFPPPETLVAMQRQKSVVPLSPLSNAKSPLGSNSPSTKTLERKSQTVKPAPEEVGAAAVAIVTELRARVSEPVLAVVVQTMLAEDTARQVSASENVPPAADAGENAPMSGGPAQALRSSNASPNLPQLRAEIQRISAESRVLLPGPEATEVRALLRRVEALMRLEGASTCTTDVVR